MTNHNNHSTADLLNAEGGRGRRILPWIIEQANNADEMTAFHVTSLGTLHAQLWHVVNDVDKLIELIVDDGGRLEISIGPFVGHGGPEWMVWRDGDNAIVDGCDMTTHRMPRTIAQLRSILAALAVLNDGDSEGAERVLRGMT
jgi:hypothetical protein